MRFKRVFIKRFWMWMMIVLSLMLIQSVAVAAYIGPNRTRTVTNYLRVCYDIHISPWPETCRCNPGGPGQRCGEVGSSDYGCYPGESGNDSCDEETGSTDITDPPATVSGMPACSLNGNSGWCRGQVTVNFSANEPVAGKVITFIEGTPGTLCDPADGSSVNCSQVDSNQGATSFNFWAHTTYGDTSAMGSTSYMIDSVNPTLVKGIPTATGLNGWYITAPVNLTISGTDATSGMSAEQIQVDGGTWLNGSASISADGTHTANFQTVDVAGNTNSSSNTIKIDKTYPLISLTKTGTAGLAGWYVTNVSISPNASDATSGVASAQSRVDGGAWASSQTITTDGSHTVEGQATDNAGNTSAINDAVKVDKTPPTLNHSENAPDGVNGWYVSPFTSTVSGTDVTSGLSYAQVRAGAGTWQNGSITVSADGTYAVTYRSQDIAGNSTTAGPLNIKIDQVPPSLTPSISGIPGQASWYVSNAMANSAATDATSGVATKLVQVDGGTWASVPQTIATDGTHTALFWATDNAGNETTAPPVTVKIDKTPPTITTTVPAADGSNGWHVTPFAASVDGTDATSGIELKQAQLNAGTWQSNTVSVNSDGTHTLNFRTQDKAGNTSLAGPLSVKLDQTAPILTPDIFGTFGLAGWYVSEVIADASATDATSGVASTLTQVDGGAWVSTPRVITSDGTHAAVFRADDLAGNTATTPITNIKIDRTAPSANPSMPAPDGTNGWHITNFTANATGTDATSGLAFAQVQMDGGAWGNSVNVAVDGTHALNFRSQDNAGNTNTLGPVSVKLDKVAPASGISLTGTSGLAGWYISNVAANPTGTDTTSGISSREVQVDGGAWLSSAAITTDGTHSINGRSLDNAGLSGTSSTTAKIDKTLPTITGTIPAADGLNGWLISPATLSASGSDSTSGLWDTAIALDGGAWQGSPYTVTTEGTHSAIFRSRDNAGNSNTTNGTFKLDLVSPTISPSSACTFGLNGWCIAPATLSASGTDAVSGIDASSAACNYDGLGWNPAPITLGMDGNHNAICRISDLAGHSTTSPVMNIKVDQTDPMLNYNIPAPDGANGWRVSETTVTVSGSDVTSGLWDAAIALDGAAWQLNSAPVTTEGNHAVDFRTRDNAGNENTATGTVKIDLTDPTSSITRTGTTGANGWYVSTVTANPTGTDAVSGVEKLEIQADAGAWQPSLNLTDGVYDLTARTTDLAGRTATSPKLATKVDATLPVIIPGIPTASGLNGWHVTSFNVGSAGTDATSGVAIAEVQLNGGTWMNPVSVAADGTHALNFRVTDKAGNINLLSNQPVKLDATAPTLVVDETGIAGAWYISPATVTATGTDATSGLDRTEMSEGSGVWQATGTMTLSTDGVYTVNTRAFDLAGNTTNAPAKTIHIDQTPPVLAMMANGTQGDNGWWVSPLTIFSQASDATSGLKTVEGKLNTGAWIIGTSVVVADNGESIVNFRAEDVAGHTTTVKQSYKVDAVKPLVTITSPAANDVLSGIVTVTGTAGDAHSGLRMAEMSLNGSTWEGMPVSAGGWTYTWDTRTRGSNLVMVRTTDVAGNINIASVPVIVANAGPSITLTNEWYIWQTGELVVRAGDSDLARVTVVISDVQDRWPAVTLFYSGDLIPEVVKWDRKFANGVVAPPGRYLASAEAVDVNDKSASAVGWIVIPQPAQPTATPTAVLPTATTTAQSTATATATPEPTEIPAIVATPVFPPIRPIIPEPVLPPAPIFALWLFLLAGIVGLVVLSTTAVVDRRPQEINKITDMIRRK